MSDDIPVRPVGTYDWVRAVSNIDFGGSDSVKGVAGRTIKGVAFRLSYWANQDGTQVIAGPARVSVICEVDYKTAKTVLGVLRKNGLLTVVRRGRGPTSDGGVRVGDEYRLTVPLDLPNRLRVRSEDEIRAAIEATKDANRRKDTGAVRPRKPASELEGSAAPVTPADGAEVTGAMVPGDDELRGNPGLGYGGNGSAVPTQDLPLKNHQPISLSDDRPSVPAPRQASPEDRERDDEASLSKPEPLTPQQKLIAKRGITGDLATQVIGYIEATNTIDGLGWWYTADRNGSLDVQIQTAIAGLDRCVRCNDEGQVWSDQFNSMLPCGTCGGSQDDTRCAKHPGQRAARCGSCRADRLAAGVERASDRQPRTSERGGYRAAKVNMEPGARTAAMARRRQAASEASPGWAVRPDGSRILVNSHDPNIDWETPL